MRSIVGGVEGNSIFANFPFDLQTREEPQGVLELGCEEFVPRLFTELSIPIQSVSVSRPSLDDVFMSYTGTTIRDAEGGAGNEFMRNMAKLRSGGRR